MDKPPPARPSTQPPAPSKSAPQESARSQEAALKVRHEGGRAVLQWAADTARMLALSASQVMRKLDTNSLKLDGEEQEPPRGQPAKRGGQMPGGGVNPYDNRGAARRPVRPPAQSRDSFRSAAPTAVRQTPSPRPQAAKPARASWWSRLLRRD